MDDKQARQYAYLDNRASEVGLAWDAEQVLNDLNTGVDLSGMFRDDELEALMSTLVPPVAPEDFSEYDEDIDIEHCCPKCGYQWSGSPD